jgi:uncharacterized membrane protein
MTVCAGHVMCHTAATCAALLARSGACYDIHNRCTASAALYCTVLYYTVLYCIVLYCTVLCLLYCIGAAQLPYLLI